MRKIVTTVGAVALFYIVLRLTTLHYLEYKVVGLTWNPFNGNVELVEKSGWNIRPPWVLLSKIDTKPTRVCITSAGRGVNCVLVKFEPDHYQEFVATEGFHLYWWYNRLSYNFGYNEEYRGMKDVLRGYAFGVQKYSFITVVESYNDSQ